MKQLDELQKPGQFSQFLDRVKLHSQWRALWGVGAMGVGMQLGVPIATEAGVVLLSTVALEKLLANDRGARLVRALSQTGN